MKKYYFAFKVNPIDVMHFKFPRPNTQDYGVVCSRYEDAQEWLQNAALTPEHSQDWLYARYNLPAMNMIFTVEPTNTIPKLPQPMPKEAIPVFAHRMQQFQIVGLDISIDADLLHDAHMVGISTKGEHDIDSPLLRSAGSEMLTRMSDMAEYLQALKNHPSIPPESLQTWASAMFANGIHQHHSMQEYFDTFAQYYTQEVQVGETLGPQYNREVVTLLAMEASAKELYATMQDGVDAFDNILESLYPSTLPYRQERLMLMLQPETYKTTLMEQIPQAEQEQFSRIWDSTLTDLRIANQVELRKGEVSIQALTLQATITTCNEMEYAAFRAQNGYQSVYAQIRTAAIQDDVRLESFNNDEREIPEGIEV